MMNLIKVDTKNGVYFINPNQITLIRPLSSEECKVVIRDYGDLYVNMDAIKLLQIIQGMR